VPPRLPESNFRITLVKLDNFIDVIRKDRRFFIQFEAFIQVAFLLLMLGS
jgi:hypothetical protein